MIHEAHGGGIYYIECAYAERPRAVSELKSPWTIEPPLAVATYIHLAPSLVASSLSMINGEVHTQNMHTHTHTEDN